MLKGVKLYGVVCLVVMGLILSSFSISAFAASQNVFGDVPDSFWAKSEIEFLHNQEIINGYEVKNGQLFRPNNNVTRAQAAKMIMIALGDPDMKVKESKFKDVPSDHWASEWIAAANELGIISGYEDGNFKPENYLTRAQMSKILTVAFGLDLAAAQEKDIVFRDINQGFWAASYINTLYYNGISNGSGNYFKPNDNITRAQFSVFISRVLEDEFRVPPEGTENDPAPAPKPKPEPTPEPEPVPEEEPAPTPTPEPVPAPEDDKESAEEPAPAPEEDEESTEEPVEEPTPEPAPEPAPQLGEAIATGTVTANSLNVRAEGNADAAILGKLGLGAEVTIYSITNNWAKIGHNNGIGYVHKAYLKLKNLNGDALKDRIIVVDAGHGGKDPGTLYGNIYEKDIVINVAKLVQQKLENSGAKVVMTRSDDSFPSLQDRVDITKEHYAELFVSIHVNAAGSSAQGTETYYDTSENDNGVESRNLAEEIQKQIIELVGTNDRGIKDNEFYVIRNQYIPSVLVELGFITNSEDLSKLTSATYQELYAEAIFRGIKNYYSE